ncbi:transcriptional regulator [Halorubrum sp. Hd13]|uniref:DUF7344 domain-containing protein n=1 Tax=Halorubrum sp. Hd13 TaxID=1480728 RepID=UPI000B985441|nr:transcriptional regulator [Halorubrum sp. Hd13]OYR46040.1 transcriptional regulator [Halorubrum sp. Hd13]
MTSTAATTNESSRNGGELSEDEVFEVLSNRRRRFVIHALKRAEEPIDVAELSVHVTGWERDVDPEAVRYEDRRNVYSTLRRTHLPKLEEKNVVTVDEEANLVEPTPELEELDIYVEVLRSREIPWSLYYVGLAGVAVSLMVAVATGTPGFAGLDAIDVGAFTATAFGISAAAHRVVGRRARLGNSEKPPELSEGT